MIYPRHCPLCGADYSGPIKGRTALGPASEFPHTTLHAGPGGTSSPREPTLPGRLLALRCRACRGEYAWDYFGGRPAGGVVPQRAARRGAIIRDAQEDPRTAAAIEAIRRPDEALRRRDVDALTAPATEDVMKCHLKPMRRDD